MTTKSILFPGSLPAKIFIFLVSLTLNASQQVLADTGNGNQAPATDALKALDPQTLAAALHGHTHIVFSPLETFLITLVVGIATAIVTKLICSRKYVTKSECELTRDSCVLVDVKADMERLCKGQNELSISVIEHAKRSADVFRIVLSKMEVPIEEQNRLLVVPIINTGGA